MSARLIDGTAHAAALRTALKPEVDRLAAAGHRPGLAVLLVGDNPASRAYVRNKVRACADTGVRSELLEFPPEVTEAALLERIAALNADPTVHGILVQLPLPAHVSEERLTAAISPSKDVDGFCAQNTGALLTGAPGFVPCTPAGVMHMLEREQVPLAGRHAVVIGRSNIVGKPLALLLLRKDATVTICHSRTPDLEDRARSADILIAAVGRANMVGASMVKPGACVIDVGINRLPDGRLVGDVDFAAVSPIAGSITPVPGGVGPMTVAMLVANTVQSAREHSGLAKES